MEFSREEIFAEEILAEFHFAILTSFPEIKFRETRQNRSIFCKNCFFFSPSLSFLSFVETIHEIRFRDTR